jgi:DNA-directed RNA polymerase specialized sigma24 family protein
MVVVAASGKCRGCGGLSIAETAAALDMTQSAVRVALHRGLARLAAMFLQEK